MSRVEVSSRSSSSNNDISVAAVPSTPRRSSPRFRRKAHPTAEDAEKCSRAKQRRTSPPQSMSRPGGDDGDRPRPRRRKSTTATAMNGTDADADSRGSFATPTATNAGNLGADLSPSLMNSKTAATIKRKHKRSKTATATSYGAVNVGAAVGGEVIEKFRLAKLKLDERHCSAPPLVGDDKLRDNTLLADLDAPMDHLGVSIGPDLPASGAKAEGGCGGGGSKPTRRSWLFNLRRARRLQQGSSTSSSEKPSKSRRRSVSRSPSGNPCPNTVADFDFSLPSSAATSPGTPFSPATALGSMFITTPDSAPRSSSGSSLSAAAGSGAASSTDAGASSTSPPLLSFSLGEAHQDSTSSYAREATDGPAAMVVSITPRPKSAVSVCSAPENVSRAPASQNHLVPGGGHRAQSPERSKATEQLSDSSPASVASAATATTDAGDTEESGTDTGTGTDFSFLSLSKPRGRRVRSVASLDEMVREALVGAELGDELVGRTASFVADSLDEVIVGAELGDELVGRTASFVADSLDEVIVGAELGDELVGRTSSFVTDEVAQKELSDELVGRASSFAAGSRVHHQWFGEGRIVSNDSKVLVCKFDKAPNEEKKLSARYAVPKMVLVKTSA